MDSSEVFALKMLSRSSTNGGGGADPDFAIIIGGDTG
jgi:hypothetical protein